MGMGHPVVQVGLWICIWNNIFPSIKKQVRFFWILEPWVRYWPINYDYYQGSYNQWFLQSGVLQSGVLTIRGSYNQGFLRSGVLQSGVLTTKGSYDQGSYNQGFLQSGVLTIRGSYNQGFKSTCLTWRVCAQMLILIIKSYDQGSVLIVNSRIQCVSSAQMLKLTLQDYIRIKPVPRCLLRL